MEEFMPHSFVTASAPAGELQGLQEQGIHKFLGIRYAQAPVGENRFRAPKPMSAASEVIEATRFGDRNFQVGLVDELYAGKEIPGEESEDCLFLNVYAPANLEKPCPVMVWIHGGAFQSGSGNEYDPTRLVRDNDIIVVTVNYRLGIFGFFNLEKLGEEFAGSSNLGIQDQIAALRWVRDNVAAFGGDAGNVTIFGESAGAASVLSLLGAPAAEGLFHKAIVCSGAETLAPALDQLDALKAVLGSESDEACLEQLMAMPAAELSQLQQTAMFYAGPGIDGKVITRPSCEAIKDGGSAGIPIMAGTTRDEGTLLAPYFVPTEEIGSAMLFGLATSIGRDDGMAYMGYLEQQFGAGEVLAKMTRAWFDTFRASALRVALTAAEHGAGGWVYDFDVETDHELGVTHFADVPFTFNWIEEDHPWLFVHPATETNQRLAEQWSKTVVAFARDGNPNGQGLPDWPQYKNDEHRSLRLSQAPAVVANPDGDLLAMYKVA